MDARGFFVGTRGICWVLGTSTVCCDVPEGVAYPGSKDLVWLASVGETSLLASSSFRSSTGSSVVNACTKASLRRWGHLDSTPPTIKLVMRSEVLECILSFYSGCYRSFVLEIFTASMAYHAVVLLHTVRGPWGEACVLPTAAVACRPYPCQVGHTIVGSSMPVSSRLHCVGSTTLEI
ncbi:hypothetical protein BHM03_00048887 [Ensete ventricosum]|nr:hypothetical protein BHM03_00048887 [Ensete ventricosum]